MGKILDWTLENLDDMLAYTSRWMIGKDFASYCDLATAVGLTDQDIAEQPDRTDPYILVTNENSFLTVFQINGNFQILSDTEYEELIENLHGRMMGYFRQHGHSLSFSFERDPDRAAAQLHKLAAPMLNSAKRIGLDTQDIIQSRMDRNLPFVAGEQNLLVIYTHLDVLQPTEKKRAIDNYVERARDANLRRIEFGQNPFGVLMELKSRHNVFVGQVAQDLRDCGVNGSRGLMLTPLSAHQALYHMRKMVNKEQTPDNYRAVLPGDKFIPHGVQSDQDLSGLTCPRINYQLCNNDLTVTVNQVQTGRYLYGFLTLELGPQDIKSFNELFNIISRDIPWRVRYDISPGGLNKLKGRYALAQLTSMIGDNRSIYTSLKSLENLVKEDSVICGMKITFCTWAEDKKLLSDRIDSLATSIMSWGNPTVCSVHGDPMAAWASTIPGFTLKNPANLLVPPLEDALSMLPLRRPATPWEVGNTIVRTPDGKVFPIELGSSLQDTHIDSITSPPGGGKSLLLNVMNFSEIHAAGRTRLPLITIVDVGASSKGLIDLIRNSLPEARKDEAVYLKLQNSAEYAVNPFDTQLGARWPTSKERDFLIDLLTLFCTDPGKKAAPADCTRIAEMLLDIAYKKAETHKTAERYAPAIIPEVDAIINECGIHESKPGDWWESASWYEITDLLFEHGHPQLAAKAQRYAVPTLSDIIQALNDESVKQLYGSARLDNQETILSYMNRCLTASTTMFSLFSTRTVFELSAETRIISIDLQEVVGSQSQHGKLETAVMYMFSRHLAARNYFLSEDTILPVTPSLYHAYHKQRVEDVQQERKIIAYDEFHNTGGQEAFINTIIKDGREGRKWGIRIVLVSQFLEDFPDPLLLNITSMYVMKYGLSDERTLREKLGVSEATIQEFKNHANGPKADGSGSNFLAIIRTKLGEVSHILTNTIGPLEAWAFTTRAEDMALRNKLYKAIGTAAARKFLARKFPLGSADNYIKMLQQKFSETESQSVINHIVEQLIADYTEQKMAEAA